MGLIESVRLRLEGESQPGTEADSFDRLACLVEILDGYDDGIVLLDDTGRILGANRLIESVLGTSSADLTGKLPTDVFPGLEPEGGSWRPVEASDRLFVASPHLTGNVNYWRFRDVTRQEQRTERLKLLEKAIEQSRDVFLITRPEPGIGQKIVYVNAQFTRQTGFSAEEALGNTPRMLQGPKSGGEALERVREAIRSGDPVEVEFLNYRKDGTEFWVEVNIAPVSDETGKVTHWVSVQREITERKQWEVLLEEHEQRFRALFEQMPQFGILGFNSRREIVYWNASCESIYGYSSAEAIGKTIEELMCNENERPGMAEMLNRWFQEGRVDEPGEMEVRRSDGSLVTVYSSHSLQDTPRGPEVYCLDFDLTDLKQREEERLKISRLESLGVLAGGIAHDFNNLLMAICGNVELMKRHIPETGPLREKLGRIEKAGQRATRLARELLIFAKGGNPQRARIGLPQMIEDSMTFVLHGSNVSCDISLGNHLWEVIVDEGQITQALQNLAVNAREAMPLGGRLTVRAENIRLDENTAIPLEPGEYVRLTVNDTGGGIPPEHLDRIFDPYFTTKEGGSGLGLAVTFSVIRRNGGHIGVVSEPGVGTTFSVYLPAKTNGAEDELDPLQLQARPRTLDLATGRPLRILVMDDEPEVLDMTCELLESIGFATERAAHGEDAIVEYIRGWVMGNPFAAVMLDLTVVGGLGGVETIGRLRAFDPTVKAVMCSGYAEGDMLKQFADYGFAARLNKPYDVEHLEATLARLLGVAQAATA
jgi:PAS domain S-box-containing protein